MKEYTSTFEEILINGDTLSSCDEASLENDLGITSHYHRMQLLQIIRGTSSVCDIMSDKL